MMRYCRENSQEKALEDTSLRREQMTEMTGKAGAYFKYRSTDLRAATLTSEAICTQLLIASNTSATWGALG